MPCRLRLLLSILLLASLLLPEVCQGAEKVRILIAGNQVAIDLLRWFFDTEPAVIYHAVPARDPGAIYGFSEADLVKMIRQYFPRTYESLRTFDVLILTSPEYYLFTRQQDQWMYDAITEGMGGINDVSVFSIVSGIAESWSNSVTQQAFPNDAPAVTARACGDPPIAAFRVIINREARYPILTGFIPFGVEDVHPPGGSRMVIGREGSDVLAWQFGNFGNVKVDYIVAWEYGEGRTITNGNGMGICWQGYPMNPEDNQYAPEILMNMMYWLAGRDVIEDIAVFHRIKGNFAEYMSRMSVLISLVDFIDKFGANTDRIQEQILALEEIYDRASDHYLDQEFVECENAMLDGLQRFAEAEEVARVEKDRALFWVYLIEWLAATSTFFVSGFILWTLMVRRRLYREIDATRLKAR